MIRTQACISFMLLLALRSSEGFAPTTTTTTTSSTSHQQVQRQRSRFAGSIPSSTGSHHHHQQQQQKRRLSLKRPLLPTTATSVSLFNSDPQAAYNVNNRHSSNDYWYNIKTLPSSAILRDIRNPVLAVFGWSTAVSLLHFLLSRTAATSVVMATKMCVSPAAHSFLVSALGLLLVFRTNSAYQRFYEGRKIWEQILSVSRNLSRLTHLYSKDVAAGPGGNKKGERLRNLIAAYPYLLRHHIRSGCLCENNLKDKVDPAHRLLLKEPSMEMVETRHEGDKRCGGTTSAEVQTNAPAKECWVDRRNFPWSLLTPGALEKVARSRNRPLWICNRLGREICNIPYGNNFTNRERQHFLNQVEKLTNAIGQCERIHQTAVPLNYARHSLRSLTIWLFTLPFALVKDLGFMTGPAAAVIAWLLFGVYEIGYSIEDPFQGSLRLSNLCDAIRNDVLQSDGSGNDDDDSQEDYLAELTDQPSDWIDEAAQDSLRLHILDAANLAASQAQMKTPLAPVPSTISRHDYEEIEK